MVGWIGLTASFTFSSAITGVDYSQTPTAATPAIFPIAGSYNSNQTVSIATATPGAAIYYTTNGSTPSKSSTLYSGPISVSASQTVKAIAVLTGWTTSAVASTAFTVLPWTMEFGTIDSNTSGNFALTGSNTGTLSASAIFDASLCAATAFQNIGTSNNTVSVTFTFHGSEGGGGVAVGLRWNHSSQEGDLAYIDTSGSHPILKLWDMSSGWSLAGSADTSFLTMTSGNSYTLTITDNGSTVTASITDDVGLKTCNVTPSLPASNTEVMIGWAGTIASHTFLAVITAVSTQVHS